MIYFLIFAQNIDYGYTLEPPHGGMLEGPYKTIFGLQFVSKAIVLLWFSFVWGFFCARVSVTFHFHISSVWITEWPILGKAVHSVDHMFSLYFDYL